MKALIELLTDFAREHPIIFFFLMLLTAIVGWLFITLSFIL